MPLNRLWLTGQMGQSIQDGYGLLQPYPWSILEYFVPIEDEQIKQSSWNGSGDYLMYTHQIWWECYSCLLLLLFGLLLISFGVYKERKNTSRGIL